MLAAREKAQRIKVDVVIKGQHGPDPCGDETAVYAAAAEGIQTYHVGFFSSLKNKTKQKSNRK